MSWQSLIKPPGKDPKNINEWLALITDKIRELKQTENWYDVSRVVMTSSIVDNLESHRTDAILSANQGRELKELIDELEIKVNEISEGLNTDISEINQLLEENIPKINSNIESISQLSIKLEELTNIVTQNGESIETINNTITGLAEDISELEQSLNILSDRVNKNNESIIKKVDALEDKVDENVNELNDGISDIRNDIDVIVGGNEIISGLDVTISDNNQINVSTGKVLINGNVIDINNPLSISVTPDLLNKDYILLLTVELNEDNQPILSLVETIDDDKVLISKLSVIDGKIADNSKLIHLQPINTMIGLAADNEAETVRESIPSGFTTLGELDYDYMINNENQVKLKSNSIAYVNGYKVEIPKDTIINIGKAPEKESREDLIFLEVWKDNDFPKTGKVKWRIRHVEDVDFDKYINDGFNAGLFIDWNYINQLIRVQGGNVEPLHTAPNTRLQDKLFCNCFSDISLGDIGFIYKWYTKDIGLYICGTGDFQSKDVLKTIDGRVYAIPMFRVFRKPSCGKSIPFEYSKINPKVDYSKFSKLMKEEKVERVVNDNVKGRSLLNLSSCNPSQGTSDPNTLTNPFNIRVADVTIIVYNMPNNKKVSIAESDATTGVWVTNTITDLSSTNSKIYIPKKDNTLYGGIIGSKDSYYGSWTLEEFKAMKILALEGDWTDKEIPEYFEGLKSLGEDDGNLITVKNGILDDDNYDVNDGNQKLNTFSEVTHVLSENNIIPPVEAVVKKGDEQTPLEKLGTKLETEGNEVIEFTKIKGRTLQNIIVNTDWIINTSKDTAYMIVDWSLLKPNTRYTYYIYNLSDKVNKTNGFVGANFTQPPDNDLNRPILINSVSNIEAVGMKHPHVYGSNFESSDFTNTKIIILEGDYTNTPLEELPFVEGIKSVGEQEGKISIKTCGKNLFTGKVKRGYRYNGYDNPSDFAIMDSEKIKVTPSTTYTFKIEGYNGKIYTSEYADKYSNTELSSVAISNGGTLTVSKGNYLGFCTHHAEEHFVDINANIQFEEGVIATNYEPYKSHKQEIHLNEPLRSLPNGVCDEIVGNKVTRRVGKVVLDGSSDEVWTKSSLDWTSTGRWVFIYIQNDLKKSGVVISDKFVGESYPKTEQIAENKYECISSFYSSSEFRISINVSKLESITPEGFKTWLSQNPTTVYYELANPVEEYLENEYDKESIKTYQLDAPLRSLPNGVKDEIKDGVLIRRCGEIILDGKEYWRIHTLAPLQDINIAFFISLNFANTNKNSISILSNRLKSVSINYYDQNDDECISVGSSSQYSVMIKINRNKLETQDVDGFKKWLQDNPIKIIHELTTPIETLLSVVKPQTANFTLQRQFAEGNWLRELPDGVKDAVENGKVIRRTKKLILNGSENWGPSRFTEQSDFIGFELSKLGLKPGNRINLLCNKFRVVETINQNNTCEGIQASSTDDLLWIKIYKSKLSEQTVQGLKTWLQSNPITVIYELATPIEEALSTDNNTYYPYHEFNTYCGSMYVGEGRNYIKVDNKMPSEDKVVIDTDFREIEGKAKVDDCKYKKCDEGYDTEYTGSRSYNLLDVSQDNIDFISNNNIFKSIENGFTLSNTTALIYSAVGFKVYLKAGVEYRVSYKKSGPYGFSDLKLNNDFILNLNSGITFTVTTTGYYSARFYCTGSTPAIASATFTDIIISEGQDFIPYESFNPCVKYLENTEENDVEDLRHLVSLTGFNYDKMLNESFDKLLRGEL